MVKAYAAGEDIKVVYVSVVYNSWRDDVDPESGIQGITWC